MTQVSQDNARWWSFGHVWMVVAGPAIVVVASFLTFFLAVRSPDPVLPTSQSADDAGSISHAPAIQARNHAAAGTLPVKSSAQKP